MTEEFRERGKRLSNWDRWGEDDCLGTLNLITPHVRAEAARMVRTGVSIPLGLPFDREGPQLGDGARQNPVHIMTRLGDAATEPDGFVALDDVVFMHTRCGTHVDSLAHVSYDGLLYNGHLVTSVRREGASALGIEGLRTGIQSRGVLLDLPRLLQRDGLGAGEAVGVADLERAEVQQGVEVREGDTLLLRTGWMRVFTRDRDRARFFGSEPGIVLEVADWLHERGVAFLAADNWGVEVAPGKRADATMPVRCVLTRDMGMPLGELFDLDAVAEHCAATGTWEFQFTCHPLPITGGVGSPVAPIATF